MKKNSWVWILVGAVAVNLCISLPIAIGMVSGGLWKVLPQGVNLSMPSTTQAAPDFDLPTLSGGRVQLSSFSEKPLVLAFGTTWCPSCGEEAPVLQQISVQHPEVYVLLIDPQESRTDVAAFAGGHNLTFTIALDESGAVADSYRVRAIPCTFFVDTQGQIRYRHVGVLDDESLEKGLKALNGE